MKIFDQLLVFTLLPNFLRVVVRSEFGLLRCAWVIDRDVRLLAHLLVFLLLSSGGRRDMSIAGGLQRSQSQKRRATVRHE